MAQRYPDLHLTLGVEPLLLEQLRAQAGGFTVVADGKKQQLAKDSAAALNAAQALTAFKSVAGSENLQVDPRAVRPPRPDDDRPRGLA